MDGVHSIPDGYPRLSPYLAVDDAAAAIEFYCSVLGAVERMRMGAPGGGVGHAELLFGDSVLMLADEAPQQNHRSPRTYGGTPVSLSLYVDDVDDTHRRALEAGATETRPVSDQFYGDRVSGIEDPWGHHWHLATHVEDVSEDEMARRAEEAIRQGDPG